MRRSWVFLVALSACAPVDADGARAAWLHEALVTDNLVWMSRDPQRLAEKYEAMAKDPYDWYRASAGVLLRDLGLPAHRTLPIVGNQRPEAASLLLVGDPHPENVGTFAAGGEGEPAVVEFNDFDGAGFGSWTVDLRRGGVGVGLVLAGFEGCDCVSEGERGYVEGWLGSVDDPESPLGGRVIERAIEDAAEDATARKRLVDNTVVQDDGSRRLLRDEALVEGAGQLGLSEVELAQVERLWAGWSERGRWRLVDSARRYGSGVASWPAIRYVWLIDEGIDDDSDDRLVQVREVIDPPALPILRTTAPGLFDDGADRAVGTARRLWSRPGLDPALGAIHDGDQVFKVSSWGSLFQGIDREDLVEDYLEGKIDRTDVLAFVTALGRGLGAAHRRGGLATGGDSALALDQDLEGREEAVRDQAIAAIADDRARSLADHERFLALLEAYGPLLGADQLADDPSGALR